MRDARPFSDELAGPFDPPPVSFEDGRGRRIDIRRFGDRFPDAKTEREALVEMYVRFDPVDRAQGIPPTSEPTIREWLDTLFVDDAVNVLAWVEDTVGGHAVLVPDDEGAAELAIFVDQALQGAGVGTRLIRALLGAGAEDGVDRVWLTVERWNRAAIALYTGVGFETTSAGSFDLEMMLRLG